MRENQGGEQQEMPFSLLPVGYISLSQKFGYQGQYLPYPIPKLFLPPGYILQVGIVNPPGFMYPPGKLV